MVVFYIVEEVEIIVYNVVEEFWKWKELGYDFYSISIFIKLFGCVSKGLDIESISKRVYK